MLPERTNTTTVKKERTSQSEQLQARNEASHNKLDSLSVFKCVPSMHRGRVFIGDGSPTTLRYYTVMPPNNYIPGIFPGYNRIFTSFGKLHPSLFCPLGPLQPIGPITRFPVRLSKRSLFDAFPSGLRLRSRRPGFSRRRLGLRLSPLLFVFACGQPVFTVGASVFATLRFSSSSPVVNQSLP